MELNIVLPVKNAQQSDLTQRKGGKGREEKKGGEKREEEKIVYNFWFYIIWFCLLLTLNFTS